MRPHLLLSFALSTIALGLAACGPSASMQQGELLTQSSDLVGIWRVYDVHCTPGYMIFRPDGSVTWSCNRDGSSGITGRYRLVGSQFIVHNDFCGGEGRYEIRAQGSGQAGRTLRFKVIRDDCTAELNVLAKQAVTWDSPLP